MRVILWKTEIAAKWSRALVLTDFRLSGGCRWLEVEEEEGKQWRLEFKSVQAWKVTSEECAYSIVSKLPDDGGMFTVQESDWLRELGNARPLQKSQHFVICCYDEIVEVLAWDCSVTRVVK